MGCVAGCGTASRRSRHPTLSHEPRSTARALGRRFMHRNRPSRVPWRWDGAIAMLGVARLNELTDDPAPAAFVDAYLGHHRGRARLRMPDHCAPALAAIAARRHITADQLDAAVTPVAEFLRGQPRNPLGALDHLGVETTLSRVYPASIWIDSLMMYALSAVAIGRELGDAPLADFGYRQPAIFAEVLQDRQTGLFRHAYLHTREVTRPRDRVFWLRGNGWVAAALADMLETDHEGHAANAEIFESLCQGLLAHQSDGGMWPTVIRDRRTYLEPSGSALVGYALAKGHRCGLLPRAARDSAERVFEGVAATLRTRGEGLSLPGVSGPTIPTGRRGYASVPRGADIDYGVGAVLMLAAELSRPEAQPAPSAEARSPCTRYR
ncbi:MAG: glycoside hydrolase family 88 protein [Myxococcota bacterium]